MTNLKVSHKTIVQKAIGLTLLLFVFMLNSSAQKKSISFDKLTVESGLSQSSVISITQDSMGFMWFGTKDGLNRYDSRQFEIFKSNPNDSTSLSSNQNINALLTDSKGNLWVGTQNGLNKYVPQTKSFIRFLNDPKKKNSLSNNTIRCIYEDKDGNLWIGTENGLNKLHEDGTFERFFCENGRGYGVVNPIIKAVYQDSKRNLWVGTQAGLVTINLKNGIYKLKTYFHSNDDAQSLSANDINSITEDLNHNLWIGTHFNGLNLLSKTNVGFKHFTTLNSGLCSNIIRKILVDKDGFLWIATLNGISIYDPVNQEFKNQLHNPEESTSLNQNSIYDIFQDQVGSIWVGTYYGGVNVYHPNAITFKVYKHYSYKNSLSSNIISAMEEDKLGNLWIGTEAEGLNYYHHKTGYFTNFKAEDSKNGLSSNLIKAVSLDNNQNLWIAAYEGGIDFYDTQSGKFKNYRLSKSNNLSEKRITFLISDDKDRLWVGTKGKGLYLFDRANDQFMPLSVYGKDYYLPSLNIINIYQDRNKNIWVAADNGVFYLRHGQNQFVKLIAQKSSFLNHVVVISQASDGKLLFGSSGDGFAYYSPKQRKLFLLNTRNSGLPSNNIAAIVEDNEQALWLSTDKGIAKIAQGNIRTYNRNDGLPGNVFNYHSVLKDTEGTLYFGGYNGLVSFDPEGINENKTAPKVVFTHLRLFNKEINVKDDSNLLPKSLNTIDELVFNYQQNVFSLDFSALNFVKAKKNSYAYKLEGFDKDWNYVEDPTATFTNLPDGNYKLLVKGANNDGIWNNTASGLKIRVKPPFWKTWWAYLFYLLVSAALFYLVLRFLLIRALLKREHDVHQMKLAFFTNVSHEIRTPLTLILGPLEKLIQDTQQNFDLNKQLQIVDKNAKRLMRLLNELMDFRKIESGKMKLNLMADNIVSFVHEIYLSFQQLAIQNNIVFEFKSTKKDIEVYFDKEQLEKIIFNLLSNAFKFTDHKKGRIRVQVLHQDDHVLIKILDNGKGITETDKGKIFTDFYQVPNHQQRNTGTGIGLALSKSIAKMHHGDLFLENDAENTSFCLSLKIGKEHYKPEEINQNFNVDDSALYQLQSEVDAIIYQQNPKKGSIVSNQPLVLVVDDNPEVKDFIVKTLGRYYQVITTNDGLEALGIALEKIPDVIVSDVMMPKMDGFEFCAKIKTDVRTRHIPVVLLTARTGDLHELEGLKTGADVYLTKPFSTQKICLIIENLLALHQNMRDKFSQQFSLEPSKVQIESSDQEFLNKVMQLLEDNISNSEFNVNAFASEIGMSTPVFYKKIDALTGLTVNNFIKSIRLKRALQLFQQKAGNVSEVAYMVGFNDAKYFSKEFKKQYGKLPSSYN
ncbi:response regulator [Pedobacter sp. SD-b]|uniref:histidine kinase n=1 Tax=Pedobacter segetis TaxID=2793069 RepID=A0ABS1BHN0_9SPHI|nr:two-component regulator propeller domain-containing protein [Pedobacter segetis]MBK0382352.1 response regulator [Pedobacter segetis]